MSKGSDPHIGGVPPAEAWRILATDPSARLVDVRTQAEWGFVGVPDVSDLGHTLICVEWAQFPGMSKNEHFVNAVMEEIGEETPSQILFLCRSGVRSLNAAKAVSAHLSARGVPVTCLNVEEGFEGDLDENGHRGFQNGWKFRGLAWCQS